LEEAPMQIFGFSHVEGYLISITHFETI